MNYTNTGHPLMNINNFKWEYMDMCNKVNKRKGIEFGQWSFNKDNNLEGLLDEENKWCWRNTINTHPILLEIFCEYYETFTGKPILFNDSRYYRGRIEKLWNFLEENWELFFTKNIELKYYNYFELKTNKSWSGGQITTLCAISKVKQFFPNINSPKVSFIMERGDPDDLKGIDFKIESENNLTIPIQVKEGSYFYDESNEEYIITSSVNSLKDHSNYYIFVDIKNNMTNMIMFKKDTNKIKKDGKMTIFQKELFINKINENMPAPQTLMNMLNYCGKNNIIFDMKNNETFNLVDFTKEPKTVSVTIGNYDDKELPEYLENKYKELQEFFK